MLERLQSIEFVGPVDEGTVSAAISHMEAMNAASRAAFNKPAYEIIIDKFEGTIYCVMCKKKCVFARWAIIGLDQIVFAKMKLLHNDAKYDKNGIR